MRLILLALAMLPAAFGARVEGRVVDHQGAPIARATVSLLGNTRTTTDDEGHFVFPDVEPGPWTITAQRPGFLSGTIRDVIETRDVVVTITPQATISGKVTDQNGDPAANRAVGAFRVVEDQIPPRSAGGAVTDDRGNYRIANLSAGSYYVSVQPRRLISAATSTSDEILILQSGGAGLAGERSASGMGEVLTYFPSATNSSRATALNLAAGEDARSVDISLRSSMLFSIRGSLRTPSDVQPESVNLLLASRDPNVNARVTVKPGADGAFEFRNIPVGSYTITVSEAETFARAEIDLVANIENLPLRMIPMPRITGTMRIEGVDEPPTTILEFTDADDPRTPAQHLDLGEFTDAPMMILPGRFRISWMGNRRPPEGTYIKSIRFGSQDALHAPFTVNDAGSLDFVFSANVAEVSGTVTDAAGKHLPGAIVTLWPRVTQDGLQSGGIQSALADPQGRFVITDLGPGRYFAAAWANVPASLTKTTNFLNRFSQDAVEITLEERQQATLDLKPVPSERVAAELP